MSQVAEAPDLLYGEAETELRAAVRSLFEDRCDWHAVLARTETGQTYDTGLWRVLGLPQEIRVDKDVPWKDLPR